MSDRPILYLDVDGVLNVFAYTGPDYDDNCILVTVHGEESSGKYAFDCVVPNYIKYNLNRLREHYDIVWCTAWRGSAHLSWRLILDLPDDSWEYIDYKDMKLPELLRHAGDRRWAYVDDDAAWEVGILLGKFERKFSGGYFKEGELVDEDFIWPNGRVFVADARRGLDAELTDRLIEFAKEDSNG